MEDSFSLGDYGDYGEYDPFKAQEEEEDVVDEEAEEDEEVPPLELTKEQLLALVSGKRGGTRKRQQNEKSFPALPSGPLDIGLIVESFGIDPAALRPFSSFLGGGILDDIGGGDGDSSSSSSSATTKLGGPYADIGLESCQVIMMLLQQSSLT